MHSNTPLVFPSKDTIDIMPEQIVKCIKIISNWWILVSFKIRLSFTYQKYHTFNLYNLLVFSIFSLCYHHCYLILKHFHHPKNSPRLLAVTSHFPNSILLATTNTFLSLWICQFWIISYSRTHVRVAFCVWLFTLCNVFKVHSRCDISAFLYSSFYGWVIFR